MVQMICELGRVQPNNNSVNEIVVRVGVRGRKQKVGAEGWLTISSDIWNSTEQIEWKFQLMIHISINRSINRSIDRSIDRSNRWYVIHIPPWVGWSEESVDDTYYVSSMDSLRSTDPWRNEFNEFIWWIQPIVLYGGCRYQQQLLRMKPFRSIAE